MSKPMLLIIPFDCDVTGSRMEWLNVRKWEPVAKMLVPNGEDEVRVYPVNEPNDLPYLINWLRINKQIDCVTIYPCPVNPGYFVGEF